MPDAELFTELFTQSYFDHVHEVMASMRMRQPVFRGAMPNGLPVWVITRYDDARLALTDDRLRKDHDRLTAVMRARLADAGQGTELNGLFTKHMLLSDPPDHTRLRSLLARDFTPRRIALLRPFVSRVTTELFDRLADRDGPVDLVAGLALPLPAFVIGELLGVPVEDRNRFQSWTATMLEGVPPSSLTASKDLRDFLAGLIAAKSASPGDDLLSALTRASEDGDRLGADELLATAVLLLVAGHETTSNLIGNGARLLLTEPALATRVRERPAELPAVIEELLRLDSPVMMTTQRCTTEPVTIGDVTIPADEVVMIAVGSANRDGDRFEQPERFDLERGGRGHVSFGHGVHYCLGAPLARLESEIALGELVLRFPDARLAVPANELRHRRASIMNGYTALPAFLR